MDEVKIPQAFILAIQKMRNHWAIKGNSWIGFTLTKLERIFLQELSEWIISKDPDELLDIINTAGMLHDIAEGIKGMEIREVIDPTPEKPRVLLILDLGDNPHPYWLGTKDKLPEI